MRSSVLAMLLLVFWGVAPAPAQAATASTTTAAAAQERQVTVLVNRLRARHGCRALRVDARLVKAARLHSRDMARRRYFAHDTPGGTTPWTRMRRAGYPRVAMAENIAAGQRTAAEVVTAWMHSPHHRANILNCSMRAVGVGLATGGPYGRYWTQDFGAR